jgi:hypothetical protein
MSRLRHVKSIKPDEKANPFRSAISPKRDRTTCARLCQLMIGCVYRRKETLRISLKERASDRGMQVAVRGRRSFIHGFAVMASASSEACSMPHGRARASNNALSRVLRSGRKGSSVGSGFARAAGRSAAASAASSVSCAPRAATAAKHRTRGDAPPSSATPSGTRDPPTVERQGGAGSSERERKAARFAERGRGAAADEGRGSRFAVGAAAGRSTAIRSRAAEETVERNPRSPRRGRARWRPDGQEPVNLPGDRGTRRTRFPGRGVCSRQLAPHNLAHCATSSAG